MHFVRSGLTSAIFPFSIGATVGGSWRPCWGGGGFIMVPAMIYIIGMPTIAAIGTDLFQIVITSANVTLQQAMFNRDSWTLGAGPDPPGRLHHRRPVRGQDRRQTPQGEQIRILLAIIVLVLAVKMFLDLVLTPSHLVSLASGGGGH